MSPLGSPIVLQRKGSVYGANVPMITELVNDSNVQFLGKNFNNSLASCHATMILFLHEAYVY